MNVTVAEMKRRLGVGTRFRAEMIGTNLKRCRPGTESTTREVTGNDKVLKSRFLDSPMAGEIGYLPWKGITIDQRDDSYYVSNNAVNPPEEFLKITILEG